MNRAKQYDEETLNSKVDYIKIALENDDTNTERIELFLSSSKATVKQVLQALYFMEQRIILQPKGGRFNKVNDCIRDFTEFKINDYRIQELLEKKTKGIISTRTYYRILKILQGKGIDFRKLIKITKLWKSFHLLTYIFEKEWANQRYLESLNSEFSNL